MLQWVLLNLSFFINFGISVHEFLIFKYNLDTMTMDFLDEPDQSW